MRRPSVAPWCLALSTLACVTAPAPSAPPAGTLELRLAAEDRALLERLVAGLTARDDAARAQGEPSPAPRVRVEARRPSLPRDTRNRLVTEGPVGLATYSNGQAMYEGAQIESSAGWERHGPWRAWYADGKPWEEGAYVHERPHGPWRWWYEDGTLQAEGTFEEGRRTGHWRYFHANGALWAEGRHADDRAVGPWRVYDESGALVSEVDHGA